MTGGTYPIGLLQKVVYELETHKRRLGVKFDQCDHNDYQNRVWLFNRYNETENVIQEMVDKYHLDRKTKPYKLKLEALQQ